MRQNRKTAVFTQGNVKELDLCWQTRRTRDGR